MPGRASSRALRFAGGHVAAVLGRAGSRALRAGAEWSETYVSDFFRNGQADNGEGCWTNDACGSERSEASYVAVVFLRCIGSLVLRCP